MTTITQKYSKPLCDDTCIVMCFFSPVGFKKPLKNIQYNIIRLNESGIPFIVIELLYPNQKQVIPNSIVVRSNSILFSKENLWNIAEKHVPAHFNKIIFLDSDIIFDKPNWFDLASSLLDINDLIQPMEFACRDITFDTLSNGNISFDMNDYTLCKQSITKAIKNNKKIFLGLYQPGFGIGITRSFFKKIQGFFEYGITGSSDALFWLSFVEFNAKEAMALLDKVPEIKNQFLIYKNTINQYIDLSRIDYVPDSVGLHLYHGKEHCRYYQTRNKYVPENLSFFKNEDGVLEIKSIDNIDLKQYWIDRKEDD